MCGYKAGMGQSSLGRLVGGEDRYPCVCVGGVSGSGNSRKIQPSGLALVQTAKPREACAPCLSPRVPAVRNKFPF